MFIKSWNVLIVTFSAMRITVVVQDGGGGGGCGVGVDGGSSCDCVDNISNGAGTV